MPRSFVFIGVETHFLTYFEPAQTEKELERLTQFVNEALDAIEASSEERRKAAYGAVVCRHSGEMILLARN